MLRRDSVVLSIWRIILFICAVETIVTVPLRIGFLLNDYQSWLVPDIIVDVVTLVDIIVHFLTTIEGPEGEEVDDFKQVGGEYIRHGSFFRDIVSLLPLELFVLATGIYHPAWRCNRLLRTPNVMLLFDIIEKRISLKPSIMRITKAVFSILLLAHVIACIYHLIVVSEPTTSEKFAGNADFLTRSVVARYAMSLYWSFANITGYNSTTPTTYLQIIYTVVIQIVGIGLFATIIGTVGSLVRNLDSNKLEFRANMETINEFMKAKKIPVALQAEVRNYFNYLHRSGRGQGKKRVLDDLPPYLKNKIKVHVNRGSIRKVPLFEECSEEFVNDLVRALKPKVCLPNSLVVRIGETGEEMFFVARGELNVITSDLKVVHTIRDGGFFGEVALLYDTKRTAYIASRTYCDMFVLKKDDFEKVLKKHPQSSEAVQKVAKQRFAAIHAQHEERKMKKAGTTTAVRSQNPLKPPQ